MAESNITTPEPTIKDSDYFEERMAPRLSALAAIFDAVRILTALEGAPAHTPEGGLITGQGFAKGDHVVSATLPDLLALGRTMAEEARADFYDMLSTGDFPKAGANHG